MGSGILESGVQFLLRSGKILAILEVDTLPGLQATEKSPLTRTGHCRAGEKERPGEEEGETGGGGRRKNIGFIFVFVLIFCPQLGSNRRLNLKPNGLS